MSCGSAAEILASLYGEPGDRNFAAVMPSPLRPDELPAILVLAMQNGHSDAAEAIWFELRRLSGQMNAEGRSLCYGSSAGLWRSQ